MSNANNLVIVGSLVLTVILILIALRVKDYFNTKYKKDKK